MKVAGGGMKVAGGGTECAASHRGMKDRRVGVVRGHSANWVRRELWVVNISSERIGLLEVEHSG